MANINKLLGKRIREIRKKKGLTQEKLAEYLEISPPSISKIESGIFHPSEENLEKLAQVLDVEIYELYMFEHNKNTDVLKEKLHKMIDTVCDKDIKLIYKIISGILV